MQVSLLCTVGFRQVSCWQNWYSHSYHNKSTEFDHFKRQASLGRKHGDISEAEWLYRSFNKQVMQPTNVLLSRLACVGQICDVFRSLRPEFGSDAVQGIPWLEICASHQQYATLCAL